MFLDRDGTLIEEAGYLDRLERLVFFPYSVDAVRLLNRAGFAVVVVTNQAGIARGIVKEAFVAEAHRHIADAARGRRRARSTASTTVRTIPRRSSSRTAVRCDCRKPQPGHAARARRPISTSTSRARSSSATAGTTSTAGQAVGARGVLVRTGLRRPRGSRAAAGRRAGGHRRQPDRAAVSWILRSSRDAHVGSRTDDAHAATRPSTSGRLLALIDGFARVRVVVVGDLIVDEFIYGEIARVSREAPVLILNYDSTEIVPGGAGNAAANVAALGGAASARRRRRARRRPARRLLDDAAAAGVDVRGVVRARRATGRRPRRASSPAASTRRSSRSCGSIARTRAAFDDADARARSSRELSAAARAAPTRCSSPTTAAASSRRRSSRGRRTRLAPDGRARAAGARRLALRAAAVPRHDRVHAERVRGRAAARRSGSARTRASSRGPGASCSTRTRGQAVLITRGSRGMALFERDRPTVHIPIVGSDQIADVTGAGDTVIATMTLALAAGAPFVEAARLANYAGGLVVMKRGTATVSADELRHGGRRRRDTERRSSTRGAARCDASSNALAARAGLTIAFANGCFDLLHVGHVRYLQARGRRSRSPRRRGQRR